MWELVRKELYASQEPREGEGDIFCSIQNPRHMDRGPYDLIGVRFLRVVGENQGMDHQAKFFLVLSG